MDDLFRIALSNAAWAAGLAAARRRGRVVASSAAGRALALHPLAAGAAQADHAADTDGRAAVGGSDDQRRCRRRAGNRSYRRGLWKSRRPDPRARNPRRPLPAIASRSPAPPTSWSWRSLIALGWLAAAVIWWGFVTAEHPSSFRQALLRVCVAGRKSLQERTEATCRSRVLIGRAPASAYADHSRARIPPFVWASLTGRPQLCCCLTRASGTGSMSLSRTHCSRTSWRTWRLRRSLGALARSDRARVVLVGSDRVA